MSHPTRTDEPGAYERRDMILKPLLLFGVALALLIAVSVWISVRVAAGFQAADEAASGEVHPRRDQLPATPAPRLQITTRQDIDAYEAAMERALTGYRWIDPKGGVVQIPVDRALELYLQERGAEPPPAEGDPAEGKEGAP